MSMLSLQKKNIADKLQDKQHRKEKLLIKKMISILDHQLSRNEMYKGNRNLRKAGVKIKYTEEQILEINRCRKNPIYFINKYCYIVNLDDGLVKFKTRFYQDKLIKLFNKEKRVVVKFPRQSGKTVTTAAYAVWEAIFKKHSQIAILANKAKTAIGILQKVRLIYESLPNWLQSGIITWNKATIDLENGSKIEASATSSSAIRSMSISTLIIDECAFIEPGIWGEFYASVFPTVSSSKKSKIFLISTPKGMNHFYKFWSDSINPKTNSQFKNYEIEWNDVPNRDEKFKKEVIGEFGKEFWDQEFECAFLGSSGTLISGKTLRVLVHKNPIIEKFDNKLKIYELPVKEEPDTKEGKYAVLVDSGEGTGNDYSVAQVFRIDKKPYNQVATYRYNLISIREFPLVIEKIGKLYNNAVVIAENNAVGSAVLNTLVYDSEYDNVFFANVLRKTKEMESVFGIRMTKSSKQYGNSELKTNIEDGYFTLSDFDTIEELTSYIRVGTSYQADKGKHDDTITPLVIFSYFLRNKLWIEDWLDQEREGVNNNKIKAMEEDLLPIGFVCDENGARDISNNGGWETVDDWQDTNNDYTLF